jgi:hypothetical protein
VTYQIKDSFWVFYLFYTLSKIIENKRCLILENMVLLRLFSLITPLIFNKY